MDKIHGKYIIPTEDESDNAQVLFETTASLVEEEEERSFLTKKQKTFLDSDQDNILLKKDVVDNYTSEATDKPASANTVKKLKDQVNNVTFVASYEDPQASEPGQVILWIDLNSVGVPD